MGAGAPALHLPRGPDRLSPITIDTSDFRRAAAAIEGTKFTAEGGKMVATVLREGGNAVRRHVRSELKPHRRSGTTSKYVSVRRSGAGFATTVKVKAAARMAHLLEEGAKPHAIRAGAGRGQLGGSSGVMTIRGSKSPNSAYAGYGRRGAGSDVLALRREVSHPGMKGTHFFEHGIHSATPEVQTIFTKEAEAMTKILASRMKGAK